MGWKYTQPLTPSQTESLENEWEMNTFRFLSIFSPALGNIWLEAISSTHSEQLTFISFILSAKELLPKHWLIYKPVRFGLLRRWQSCPITSSGCCRGTHTSVRSWRRVRAAAIAIVSEEMGRKAGERERQEFVSKQACNSKSSCLRGGSDPIPQNFSNIHLLKMFLYFQACNQSCTLKINHGMNIHDENSELLVRKIMRDLNGPPKWQLRTGILELLLSYSKLLAVLGADIQPLGTGSNQPKTAIFISSKIKGSGSAPETWSEHGHPWLANACILNGKQPHSFQLKLAVFSFPSPNISNSLCAISYNVCKKSSPWLKRHVSGSMALEISISPSLH